MKRIRTTEEFREVCRGKTIRCFLRDGGLIRIPLKTAEEWFAIKSQDLIFESYAITTGAMVCIGERDPICDPEMPEFTTYRIGGAK